MRSLASRFQGRTNSPSYNSYSSPAIPSAKPTFNPTVCEVYILFPLCTIFGCLIPSSTSTNKLRAISMVLMCLVYLAQWTMCFDHMSTALPRNMYLVIALATLVVMVLHGTCMRRNARSKCLIVRNEFIMRVTNAILLPVFVLTAGTSLLFGPVLTLASLILLQILQYVGQWEELYSLDGQGKFLKHYGPSEAMGFFVVVNVITYFTGPSLWQEVFDFGFAPGLQVNHIFFFIMAYGVIVECIVCMAAVGQTKNQRESSVFYDEQKSASFVELMPLVTVIFGVVPWSRLFEGFYEEPRPLMWASSLTLMMIIVQLAAKRLSSDDHMWYHPAVFIPFIGVFNAMMRTGYGLVDEFTLSCVLVYAGIIGFVFQVFSTAKYLRGGQATLTSAANQSFSFDV